MKNFKVTKLTAFVILWITLGIIYSPIYVAAWLLRIIARFLLAISYFGLLRGKMGCQVFKSLFSFV